MPPYARVVRARAVSFRQSKVHVVLIFAHFRRSIVHFSLVPFHPQRFRNHPLRGNRTFSVAVHPQRFRNLFFVTRVVFVTPFFPSPFRTLGGVQNVLRFLRARAHVAPHDARIYRALSVLLHKHHRAARRVQTNTSDICQRYLRHRE